MTNDINYVILSGRLTGKPELLKSARGADLCKFCIASNRKVKNSYGEWDSKTNFVDCLAWGKRGETIAKWFDKGDEIFVCGALSANTAKTETGVLRKNTAVFVNEFNFGDKKKKTDATTDGQPNATQSNDEPPMPTDDDMYSAVGGFDDEQLPF